MPNRYLREGLKSSPIIQSMTWAAECMYIHMLLTVDDYGRMEFDLPVFRSLVFPRREIRDADVSRLILECEKAGAVRRYGDGKKQYLVLPKSDEPRARTSRLPQPPGGIECWRETESGHPKYSSVQTCVNTCIHVFTCAGICPDPVPVPVLEREAEKETEKEAEKEKEWAKNPPTPKGGRFSSNALKHQLPLLLQTPEFLQAWRRWLKYLGERRKVPTLSTVESQLRRCEKMGEESAIAAIESSITNGWMGLFEKRLDKPATIGDKDFHAKGF